MSTSQRLLAVRYQLIVELARKKLFSAILETFADTDVFSHSTSPSIFIVYAHDNDKEGVANAWCVRRLIEWLGAIRSRTLSDKSPLPLWSTREGGSAAIQNILDNQFCLLPAHDNSDDIGTIKSVDKVIVCGSELLKRYYENTLTVSYVDAIGTSYTKGQTGGVVESNCCHDAFHHVLTELAFLKLRRAQSLDNQHGIIPVTLDRELMTYLPFLENCDLVLKLKSFEEFDLHRLFFRLLQQIYKEEHSLVRRFENCYNEATERLKKEATMAQGISQERLDAIVYSEIHKAVEELKRFHGATLRNVIRESRPQMTQVSVLRDLATMPYRDRKDRNQERIQGTCEWFTSHQLFLEWKDSKDSKLLWVSADPGCGKSVLAKRLVDNVLPTTSTRSTCYFFFKDEFEDQSNLESAMRCLLHQLFVQKPALLTDEVARRFGEDKWLFASFAGLWDILVSVATHKDAGEIICILDALDECEEGSRTRLAKALNSLYRGGGGKFSLKFLLTSRPYGYIQREFQILEDQWPKIHLKGSNQAEVDKISKEIDIVIRTRVKETAARLKLNDEIKQLLQDELTRSTHRTYLWVYLIFDVINESIEITRGDLQANIRKIPTTVEAAYEKILSKSLDETKARRLLHIVVAARRPLSLKEMETALAIKLEHMYRFQQTIRKLCGLFVTTVDSKIYLLHQTAREFLIYKSSSNSLYLEKSHIILAEICMRLLFSPDIKLSSDDNLPTLVEYAANNWAVHFRKSYDTNTLERLALVQKAERLCDESSERCKEWLQIYWSATGKDPLKGFTALIVASYFGLDEVVRMLLERKELNLDRQDETHGRSALFWACNKGHEGIVRQLLKKGAKVDIQDENGLTPLSVAQHSG
ncbi:hypothetical protein K449DRAFT_451399, partial [Hypoxylon sp. EC38]